MTKDDDSSAAIRTNRALTRIEPKNILKFSHHIGESHSEDDVFKPGTSDHVVAWFHLPWIASVVIMATAILTYFVVHPWPEAYTEAVLGIIVGGTAVASGSRAINLLYKK